MMCLMSRCTVLIVIVAGLGCNSDKNEVADRFTKAAGFLESMFERMQGATGSGQYCFPLIDGYVRHRDATLGVQIAKEVRNFEAYFDFATIVLDVYKSSVGDRFNSLAQKYQAWKSGPYATAVEACQSCARNGRSKDEPLRFDIESCRVP